MGVGAYADDAAAAPEAESSLSAAATDEKTVGPYQLEDEDLVKKLRQWFLEAHKAKSTVNKKRATDWKFLAGGDGQWEQADVESYSRTKRPRITINLLQTILAAVEGEERTNRQEIKYFGQGGDDDAAAHGMNLLLKWVMDQCGGQFALSGQFRRMAAVGEGWIVPDVDFFDDPAGMITLEVVNDDEIFDDPLAKSPVSKDSRFMCRVRMMAADELDARWEGTSSKLAERCQAAGIGPETDGAGARDIYSTANDVMSPKVYDGERKLWAVVETWWYQIEPGWIVVNEATGELEEKTDAEFEVLKKARADEQFAHMQAALAGSLEPVPAPDQPPPVPGMPAMPQMVMPQMPPPIDAKQRPIKRIYQAFTCHDELLQKGASPLQALKRFPYVPARAIYEHDKNEWKGLLRDLLDPQRQHNVEQSTLVQAIMLQPKQGWMAPKGAYVNKNEWAEKVAMPGAMLEYNGTRGKPEPIPAPTIPRHLIDLAMTRPQAMREISGVNVEMQGVRQGSDPGVVLEQRSKAAKTVLAPIFDNFRQSKQELGRVLLAYIQTYVAVGRRIRVLGPQGATYVQFTQDMKLGRYDLVVEETNQSINDRVATLNILQTTLPAMMKAGMTATPDFVDLMPMPPHVRDSWKRQISWEMTIAGRLPPANWKPGDPVPLPGAPPTDPTAAPAIAA